MLLQELLDDTNLTEEQKKNVQIVHQDYLKETKLPSSFVSELSGTTAAAFLTWEQAKNTSDFSLFKGALEKIVSLKRQEAKYRGYENHPYDALLDMYESGSNVAYYDAVFSKVKNELVPFIKRLISNQIPESLISAHRYEKEKQWGVCEIIVREL